MGGIAGAAAEEREAVTEMAEQAQQGSVELHGEHAMFAAKVLRDRIRTDGRIGETGQKYVGFTKILPWTISPEQLRKWVKLSGGSSKGGQVSGLNKARLSRPFSAATPREPQAFSPNMAGERFGIQERDNALGVE
jgi:hypothetical protein